MLPSLPASLVQTMNRVKKRNMVECCPKFDPSTYSDDDGDPKLIIWENRPFVKDGTYCFYYIPLAFGRATVRALKKISDAGAESSKNEFMILSDCYSPWYSNIYLSVEKDDVEGAEIEKISGSFLAKVFQGEYSNMGKWANEMKEIVREKKGSVDNEMKLYFLYPYCPKCAQQYGENYVVILAKIS